MEERSERVQTDQEVAARRQRLVNVLDPLSESPVGIDQRRQLQTEERNSLPLGAQDDPAKQRQHDHQRIESPFNDVRNEQLPPWGFWNDGWSLADQACRDSQPHQEEHSEP